ncbi:hypothetical protein [Thiolapillus sp.]|uniref:hypothetical protein n=1 Tax=Thiolapillus sp. TaxID=2017437 RepID=UPI0035A88101
MLGLIFLKYVSDLFEAQADVIRQRLADPKSDLYIENEEIPGSRAIARMLGPAPLSCSALIL